VSAVAELHPIDPERMWIAGWSGGATYIGWHTQELEKTFAALVLHGGGGRPARSWCSEPKASIYFLGGDRNPLRELAEQLHEYYASTCPHDDLTWTVLRGADHGGERRALSVYREPILDWLASKRRIAIAAAPPPEDAGDEPAAVPFASPAPSAPATTPAPPPAQGCRCAVAGASAGVKPYGSLGALAVVMLAIICRRSRERGARRSSARRPRSSRWTSGPPRSCARSRRPRTAEASTSQ
jgi:hypothetical protein